MSREVQLTYPRLRLFRNCVLATPFGKVEYSISTNWNRGTAGRTTTIYALSPSTQAFEESSIIDEKSASRFNEYIPVAGRQPVANSKSVVAEINFHNALRREVTVEVPNRQRMGGAAVGPMRRNLSDLCIRNASGESVVLDVGGKICECVWVQKDYHTRELRIMSNNALVAAFQDEEARIIGGRTLSPNTHIIIHTDVVANYISNAYSDRTPRIFAATAMQEDIVGEILIAYLLFKGRWLGQKVFMPRILKESSKFLSDFFYCSGRSKSAVSDDDLGSENLAPSPPLRQATRRAASY